MDKNEKTAYILDASAFIGGFEPKSSLNFTIPEITDEVKDMKSKLILEEAINENKLTIKEPSQISNEKIDNVISNSGDNLRLSGADKKLLSLALDLSNEMIVKIITDDYSIQNVAKILNIIYESILTEGIKGVYNWAKTCNGCRKEYEDSYPHDDCEICGSKIFKKRIKR
ncbi:PIN domain-containing protein [Methanobrevibacter filiformis]|uniref:tRNA(FMet)-specific endonuclease VapC n=1 Tax=Methanobrevibacter filiformis TaxID=55758 RepID=A0A165Z061_9EURY|nr:ribonuclease VapC [Methanobrevibacter filiformis]KZX10084.1 tRNA(fMet)-specific endonuclease VapC [Methanobrevibacter filiformis]